jgi:hypothetical protein
MGPDFTVHHEPMIQQSATDVDCTFPYQTDYRPTITTRKCASKTGHRLSENRHLERPSVIGLVVCLHSSGHGMAVISWTMTVPLDDVEGGAWTLASEGIGE